MSKESIFDPRFRMDTPSDGIPTHYPRTKSGMYLVRLSDFYDNISPDSEPEEIDEAVLAELLCLKREEKRREMQDYRHSVAFSFDEITAAALDSICEPSAEDMYFRTSFSAKLEAVLNTLSPVAKRRVCLMYYDKYTQKEIAEMEHVTQGAVQKCIAIALKSLRKKLEEFDD